MLYFTMKFTFIASVSLVSLALAPTSRAADPVPGSDDKVAKRTAQFDKLDKNSDGVLSKEEFMNRKAIKDNPAASEKYSKAFTKFDTNADGKISKDEFLSSRNKGDKAAGGGEGGE